MKNTTNNPDVKVIGEYLKGSNNVASSLKETHKMKLKIISEDETMSTQEKLDALDRNDNQLIMNWLKLGVGVALICVTIKSGKVIDLEGIKRLGLVFAA